MTWKLNHSKPWILKSLWVLKSLSWCEPVRPPSTLFLLISPITPLATLLVTLILLGPSLFPTAYADSANDFFIYHGPHGETVFTDKHIYRRGYSPQDHRHTEYETYRKFKKKYRSSEWDLFILHSARKFKIKANLIKAVIAAESNFNPYAKSSAGAMGLMQLMPLTCKEYRVTHPYHPQQNIAAGTKHLKYLLNKYHSLPLALAAYNAGESNVTKYKGIPPFPETQKYVKKVIKLTKSYANFQ